MSTKTGRIRIECDGDFASLHVFVVPADGREEIELPVNGAIVTGEVGGVLVSQLRLYPTEVRLVDTESGTKIAARSGRFPELPAFFPEVEIEPTSGMNDSFSYAIDHDSHSAALELHEAKEATR